MANTDRAKLSTCPICGYSDSSTDAAALEADIKDHIRSAHNLDPETMLAGDTIKDTYSTKPVPNEPPAAAPVASVGTNSSGSMAPPNLGHNYHGGAPGDPETDARDPLDTDHAGYTDR